MKLRPRHWLWVAFVLLLPGLLRLRVDVDVLNLLPANIPAVQGLKLHQKYFANANELIITIRATKPETAERAARTIAEQLRQHPDLVRSAIWQPPWMENPAQSAELIAYMWLNQPPEKFGELTNRLSDSNAPAELRDTQQRLATTFSPSELARLPYDPFNLMELPGAFSAASEREIFASSDGTFRLVFVQAASRLSNYRESRDWMAKVKRVVGPLAYARGSEEHPRGSDETEPRASASGQSRETNRLAGTARPTLEERERLDRVPPDHEKGSTESHRTKPVVEIRYTGGPAFATEIAGSMEGDMRTSVLGTASVVGAMFWLAHRRWRPLLWLLVLLGLILVETFALAGWVLGTLNVVSAGFAGILLGLADYGVVMYQEWRAHPQKSANQIRREIGPSILLSALATGGAFFLLNLSGLPGLGQLGTLVGLGVGVAAIVMVYLYLPPLARGEPAVRASTTSAREPRSWPAWVGTGSLLVTAGIVLSTGLPRVDRSSEPLRPRNSQAYAALEEMRRNIGDRGEPLWLIIRGKNEMEVAQRMDAVARVLGRFTEEGKLSEFQLPRAIWPMPANQQANRATAEWLGKQYPRLKEAALQAGFTSESLFMTEQILQRSSQGQITPTNSASRWLLDKVIARTPDEAAALGFAQPARTNEGLVAELTSALAAQGTLVAGWETLGGALLSVVRKELRVVLAPVVVLVGLALWLAFRRVREIVFSLVTVCIGGVALLVAMRIAGWEWNLMNLLALPLVLGSGVDYTIHMLSSLRRTKGDLHDALHTTGRALLLAGGTTVVGFASLAWSSNAGLASLGMVCATGIGGVLLISVYLLPFWWKRIAGANSDQPSSLYRAGFWRLGMGAVRVLPLGLAVALGKFLATVYWALNPTRRKIVTDNLAPVTGDRRVARKRTRELFRHFSVKLIDLWRFEAGWPVKALFTDLIGWEHFTAAQSRGQGILLVTCHLGNWEFGAPLLIERGFKLHVVTLVEPGEGFTEMRKEFRARWGIETVVIGADTFAVVEVIKRLQDGATVALLVDRPPASSAVTVQLFGRPFRATVAAAELARASGCAVVPVVLPRMGNGYVAQLLPEISYDRAALGKREARELFTAEIMRAFEPSIRQYTTQWYHFVPVWRTDESCKFQAPSSK